MEFGNQEKPSLIRRPKFNPLEGVVYFMPKTEQGDIDVLACFGKREIEGLMSDPEWNQYAEWII